MSSLLDSTLTQIDPCQFKGAMDYILTLITPQGCLKDALCSLNLRCADNAGWV